MTHVKQLITSFVFCLLAFNLLAQPVLSFDENYVNSKIGYVHTQEGEAELMIEYHQENELDLDLLLNGLFVEIEDISLISTSRYFNRLTIKTNVSHIKEIAGFSSVIWVEEVLPLEINGSTTPGAHNARLAHEFGYRGAGAVIGVWEGSGINEHLDIINRYLNKTPVLSGSALNHAMAVVGIMVGNGNMDINLLGMAADAEIVIRDFQGDIAQEMADAIDSQGIIITQNSYSISPTADPCAIRGSYKLISKDIDKLVRDNPYLVHVFSAGNGQTDCSANGVTGFRTIPSGYQSAKNVITVGAINENDSITDESAWGPVLDGRIKPEVVALGEGVTSIDANNSYVTELKGTSYAAPVVSGLAAQLAARYKVINGVYPPASLVKAAICNSAIDLGQPGPDFKYGFGKVNAYNAIDCINTSRYRVDSVNHQGQVNFNIIVPANTAQLKVTLTWTDPEGDPANPKALVNDVDIGILDPNFVGYLPWVLDTTGNNKNNPATRGNERTNNIEQITIDNPSVGTHSVIVLGESIVSGYQPFSVAYEIVKKEVTINYPLGGESFKPNEEQTIWWAGSGTGTYKLEYSINGGSNWNLIKSNIPADVKSYKWTVPSSITANAKIRITQGALTDETDVFNILGVPDNLVGFGCDGVAKIHWNKVQGISVYDIYRITNGKADYFASTVDSNFSVLGLTNGEEYWYAVRARTSGGIKGKRTEFIKAIPNVDPDYNEISLVINQDGFCLGDTLRLYYTNSLGASDIEFEWRNEIGDWSLLAKEVDSAKKAIWEDIRVRAKYTNVCGKVKYTDEVYIKADTANAKYEAELQFTGKWEFKFIPEYQDTNATYLWKFGDGGNDTIVMPIWEYSFPGIFRTSLTLTTPIGCIGNDTVVVHVVGVDEQELSNLKIYPNPCNTFVDIQLEKGFGGEVTLSMYNILGKQVDNIEIVKLNNEICRINTATLPEGVYVVKLLINNKIYTNKLIIER